jgi:hypothetical protein
MGQSPIFPITFSDRNETDHWDKMTDVPWRNSRPIVEFSYGYNIPKHKRFEGEFSKIGFTEIKLGYSRVIPFQDKFREMDEAFFLASYSSRDVTEFDNDDNVEKVDTKYLRFGMGNRSGYGYVISPSAFIFPYYQTHFSFTKVTSTRPDSITFNDADILDRYEGSYRWSNGFDGGIRLIVSKSVGVTASYEATVIYPRIVFFPWLGGVIVQNITVGIVSFFGKEIVNTGHWMGPLMYALLKNGASYAVYLGMREKMNWPFNSETPLTNETFKLNLSLTF